MTDRSATEQKANTILSCDIDHNVHSFKCSVDPLLQFSDVCLQECFNVEKEINICVDGHCSSSKDPHTMFVLKCVSKLFYKDGTGDPNFSHVFFKSKGFESVPIMNFRGSRFNVCFYNAAGTFFIHERLLQYLLSLKNSLKFIQNTFVVFF